MARVSGGVSGSSTGGGTAPTGTGVRYVTDGIEDAEAKNISVIQVIQDLLSSAANVRLDLTDATKGDSISLAGTGKGQPVISCWNATTAALELVSMATPSVVTNTDLGLDGVPLAGGTIPYALYLEPDGTVVKKKWTNATTRAVALADWYGFKVYDLTDTGKQRRYIGDILPRNHWNPAAAYNAATIYYNGEKCTYGGHTWMSKHSANVGNTPAVGDHWDDCGESPGDGRGMFADETQFRLLLNAYNQKDAELEVLNPYSTNTLETLENITVPRVLMRDANGNTIWKVEMLCSEATLVNITCSGMRGNWAAATGALSIGLDSMTVPSPSSDVGTISGLNDGNGYTHWVGKPGEGYHYLVPLIETVAACGVQHWQNEYSIQVAKTQFMGTWRG